MKATLPYFLKVDKQQTQGNYRGITIISEIALVIIENGARWLVENFDLSRYNHR